jgi:hypothetical protein
MFDSRPPPVDVVPIRPAPVVTFQPNIYRPPASDGNVDENAIAPAKRPPPPPQVEPAKYTGPFVTKEETEMLHATAIAQQKELIRQQEAINAAGPATMSPDNNKLQVKLVIQAPPPPTLIEEGKFRRSLVETKTQ